MAADPNMTIEAQPIPDKLNFSTNRQEAKEKLDHAFATLPIRRALAARRGMETIKLIHSHFSLYDALDLSRRGETKIQGRMSVTQELRNRLKGLFGNKDEGDDVQGHVSPSAAEILAEYTPSDVDKLTIPLRRVSGVFGNELGIITLPAGYKLNESDLTEFYVKPLTIARYTGDMTKSKGMVELGGATLAVGKIKGVDFESKLGVMEMDLNDAIDTVSRYVNNRDKIANSVDFLMYLGVLNYLKTHSITLFHQLTSDERDLNLHQNEEAYLEQKTVATEMMQRFTRMYYQTLMGIEYDSGFDADILKKQAGEVIRQTSAEMNRALGEKNDTREYVRKRAVASASFTVPESSNPIDIALGALEATRKHPETEAIVGIPSGGTESAIVLDLMFETMKDKKLPVSFIPISLHSYRNVAVTSLGWARYIESNYGELFKNKKVLLTDDNSSTGTTLGLAANALMQSGALDIKTHVVDLDISRFEKENPGDDFFDPSHSPSTLGAVSLDGKGNYARLAELRNFLHRSIYGRPGRGAKNSDAF